MIVLINKLVDSVLLRDNGVRQDRSLKERMQVSIPTQRVVTT